MGISAQNKTWLKMNQKAQTKTVNKIIVTTGFGFVSWLWSSYFGGVMRIFTTAITFRIYIIAAFFFIQNLLKWPSMVTGTTITENWEN